MIIGIVSGTVVATQKDERLIGSKLLIVNQVDANRNVIGKDEVAVDMLGAGIGEYVLVCSGSSAKSLLHNPNAPIDLAIVGIIDSMEKE